MKNTLLLLLLTLNIVYCQSNSTFKKDSAEISQKLAIQKLENDLAAAQRVKSDQAIQDAKKVEDDLKEAKTEAQKDKDQKITNAKNLKDLIGENSITPLSGNITFSSNENGLAETRALMYNNLDILLKECLNHLNKSKCISMKCDSNGNFNDIIIYNENYYKTIPEYNSFIGELVNLKKKFEDEISYLNNRSGASLIEALSVSNSAVKALASLATLFKTETEFKINNELINERILVSKLRKLDDCCDRNYYYPTMFPIISNSDRSNILKLISEIKDLEKVLEDNLKTILNEKEGKIKPIKEKITKYEDEKNQKVTESKAEKNQTKKDKLINEISLLDEKIGKEKEIIKNEESNYNKILSRKNTLSGIFSRINTELDAVDSNTKISLIRSLFKVESVLQKIANGAYTLNISATAKGTNKIKKFLWGTTLKHSVIVELEYQLFDNNAILKIADANYKFIPFIKSNLIK